jgi:hypothetical protein
VASRAVAQPIGVGHQNSIDAEVLDGRRPAIRSLFIPANGSAMAPEATCDRETGGETSRQVGALAIVLLGYLLYLIVRRFATALVFAMDRQLTRVKMTPRGSA